MHLALSVRQHQTSDKFWSEEIIDKAAMAWTAAVSKIDCGLIASLLPRGSCPPIDGISPRQPLSPGGCADVVRSAPLHPAPRVHLARSVRQHQTSDKFWSEEIIDKA